MLNFGCYREGLKKYSFLFGWLIVIGKELREQNWLAVCCVGAHSFVLVCFLLMLICRIFFAPIFPLTIVSMQWPWSEAEHSTALHQTYMVCGHLMHSWDTRTPTYVCFVLDMWCSISLWSQKSSRDLLWVIAGFGVSYVGSLNVKADKDRYDWMMQLDSCRNFFYGLTKILLIVICYTGWLSNSLRPFYDNVMSLFNIVTGVVEIKSAMARPL